MRGRARRVAGAVGVAALAGGVAALTGRGGTDTATLRAFLYAVGGALGVWMVVTLARQRFPDSGIDLPGVESATGHPAPGDEFDRTLAQFDGRGEGFLPDRSAVHSRLRDLAVTVLVRRGYTRAAATTAVEEGEWPEGSVVAAFLRNPDVTLDRSGWDRVRELAGRRGDDPADFQRLVRRTVDALASEAQVADVDDASSESTVVLDPDGQSGDPRAATRRPNRGRTADAVTGERDVATGRWQTAVPVALAFVGFGLVFRAATLVLAGAVALGFAAYARAVTPPGASLVVERAVETDRPAPGDDVEVTTTVRNEGDRVVPDLRVVDGVPDGLAVTDGSPRLGTALRPGESTAVTYTVTARRGVHEFDGAYAVVRDYAGTTGRVRRLSTVESAAKALRCVPTLAAFPVPVPLYEQSGQYLGRLPAGSGDGVAFHSTREYRPGDPTTRIDWKHLAGSPDDDLTTVQFREERAATVVLVLAADSTAYLASGPDDPGALEHSVTAAGRLFGSLLDAGDRVGVAGLGPNPTWVDPDTGTDHRRRVEGVLATDPAFAPTAPGDDGFDPHWAREFHRRFPVETQVVLLSSLCSRRHRFVVNRLRGYGHPVTVVSPDPTRDETVGQRLVGVERQSLVETLRESGVRVVDWDPDDDLAVALGRAATRWST